MIDKPFASSGWLWDSANTLGVLTLAASLYLFLHVGSGKQARPHQLLSYGVVIAAIGHVLLMWIPDKTVWHYAAFDMPHYMWAGFIAFLGIIATLVLALPGSRRYWHNRYRHFKNWHYYLSIAIIGFSIWHIIGSGFYFDSPVEAWFVVIVAAIPAFLHRLDYTVSTSTPSATLIAAFGIAILWVALRQVL